MCRKMRRGSCMRYNINGSFYSEIGKPLLDTQNKSTGSSENMTINEYFHITSKKLTSVVQARQCKRVKFARKKFI